MVNYLLAMICAVHDVKGPAQLCPTDINLILSLLVLRAKLAKGDQAPTLDQVFRLPSTSPILDNPILDKNSLIFYIFIGQDILCLFPCVYDS